MIDSKRLKQQDRKSRVWLRHNSRLELWVVAVVRYWLSVGYVSVFLNVKQDDGRNKDASLITTLPPKPPRGACFLRLLIQLNRLARGSLNCDRTISAVATAIFLSVLSCPCFNRFYDGYKAQERPRNESKVISTAGEQLRQHGTLKARYRARTSKKSLSRSFLPPF